MSHPKLVDVIETHFVPVAIRNNNRDPKSADTATLKKFEEPAWSYQVVRFIGGDEKDLIPRRSRPGDIQALAKQMIEALEVANRPVPPELKSLVDAK